MRGAGWVWAFVVVVIAGTGLLGYFFFLNRPQDSNSPFAECYRPLGANSNIGVNVSNDGKSFALTFGGETNVSPAIDPQTLEQFNVCVSMALGNAKFDLEVVGQMTPLGEVLDHWRTSSGNTTSRLVAAVTPPEDTSINNLLVMGRGERWSVVKAWCEDPSLSACLSCQPANISEDTQSVAFSIKPGAILTSTSLGSAGPPSSDPNRRYMPWQVVRDGTRYGNVCEKAP